MFQKKVIKMKKILFFLFTALLLSLSNLIYPQFNFNLAEYQQFLNTHQNMNADGLLHMYPAKTFVSNLNLDLVSTRYLDSIEAKYGLTDFEKSLISKNGFMVSERLNKISFGQSFLEIFHKDLPVFVSTDALLHAFHISYDRILKDTELGFLIDKVKDFLITLHSNQNLLALKYVSNPDMDKMLRDVDVYLTVPLKLFGLNATPYYPENADFINSILQMIEMLQPEYVALFSESPKKIDWSQFKPRGHYVEEYPWVNPGLPEYFKVMMWLGRTELYLTSPTGTYKGEVPLKDLARQLIDSYLIKELIDETNSYAAYQEIESTIKIFAGEQDNVTLDNLSYIKNAVKFDNANELLDSSTVIEFQDTLMNQTFAYQKILSQILISDPSRPDSIVPASAFMLFGQRFVVDSYITASVVFDRIKYNGIKICRLKPSLLDILFGIGNSAAAQLLIDELNQYYYSTNLAALRYLIDSYDNDFWTANFYSNWLEMIRKLNPPQDRTTLPPFMQTAAFWQQKMNTQLASWAELRHDNLLYAKQSYTGGTVCSYPYSYVEPFPEFYRVLSDFALSASSKLQTISFSNPYLREMISGYFNDLKNISDTLLSISEKELRRENLSADEIEFLKNMIYPNGNMGSGSTPFLGWYPRLFYDDYIHGNKGLLESDHLVADMHTVPTDCLGGYLGWILHTGTGPINLGVFITEWQDGVQTAFVGPVMSYYEYTTDKFIRLTDQEWNDRFLQSALRPEWVNIYLADSTGNSRGNFPSLITSVDEEITNDLMIPASEIFISSYPNPFNSSTLIAFKVPSMLANKNCTLNIFDVNGSLIKSLINETLPSGNYIVRWTGDNNNNLSVSSGIYFYNIKMGEQIKSGKMNLLK